MKIPFIIYAQSLGIYLLLTLPTIFIVPVYLTSAWYAFLYGFAAMAVFALVFFVLHLLRPTSLIVKTILGVAIVPSVAIAYKCLLVQQMPDAGFWHIDEFMLFPIAAMAAGWISLAINTRKIVLHFSPWLSEDGEYIFS